MRLLVLLLLAFCLYFSNSTAENNSSPANKANFFIENKGQWNPEVRFLARIGGMNAWITNDGIVYDFYTSGERKKEKGKGIDNYQLPITNYDIEDSSLFSAHRSRFPAGNSLFPENVERFKENVRFGHVVKMTFAGANEKRQFAGSRKSETYYNYFIGNDSTKWASFVPLYEEVIIKNVYQGIDYRLYFENGMLRYDLNIEPFADLSQIKLKYEGLDYLEINDVGELVLGTCIGEVVNQKLYAWQEEKTNKIECEFNLDENGFVGFKAKGYKPELALVIDPLVFSTFLGSNGGDEGKAIKLDNSMNIYVTGYTYSIEFPITTGAYDSTYNNNEDVFFSKLNNNASSLVYSTFIGGYSYDHGNGIALDKNNNIYIAGTTWSANFPVTPGAFDVTYAGIDVFVCKLNSSGSVLVYSTFIGGTESDDVERNKRAIVLDSSCNAYITGSTTSSDFPTTEGAFDQSFNGLGFLGDAFVCKLNADGTDLFFSTFIGGIDDDEAFSLAIDITNNVYVVGWTESDNFPVTQDAFDMSYNDSGGFDCFVCKLNSNGSSLIYSTYFGGSSWDYATDIELDNNNNAYITGGTQSSNFPTTAGAYDVTYNSSNNTNLFISKLNNNGSSLLYSSFIGSHITWIGCGPSIALNALNEAMVVVTDTYGNFPVTPNSYDNSYNQGWDAIFCKLSSDGASLDYSTFIGGSGEELGENLTVDADNNVYIIGETGSANFPVTTGAYDIYLDNHDEWDTFILKLKLNDIRILGIINSGFCANKPFDIPFVIEGTFKPGNKFIAQISNSVGSFANPVPFDTLAGTLPDTLKNVRLPDTLSSGTGYRIRIISTNPSAIGPDNGTDIAIIGLPQPTISSGDDSVCFNSTTVYSSNTANNTLYKWQASGGTILSNDNLENVTVQWTDSSSGTLTLSHTNTISGCSNTVSKEIVILPLPQPEISGADTVCNLSYENYQGAKSRNIINKWQIKGGGIIGNDYDEQVMVLVDTIGRASLKLIQTDTVTNCMDSAQIVLTVLKSPEPVISGDFEVCSESSLSYTAVPGKDIENFWEITGGKIIDSSSVHIVVQWDTVSSGKMLLTQTDTLSNCQLSIEKEVIIYPKPLVKMLKSQTNVYEFMQYLYTAFEDARNDIRWYVKGGSIVNGQDNDSLIIKWDSAGIGELKLIVTNKKTSCSDSILQKIYIIPGSDILGAVDVCEKNTYEYLTNHKENTEYKWISSGGNIIGSDKDTLVNIEWITSGAGVIKLIKTDTENGTIDSISKNINIHTLPDITFDTLGDICLYADPLFLNMAEPKGGTYSGLGVASNIFYAYIAGVGEHNITYKYTETDFGCTDSSIKTILVLPAPNKPKIVQAGKKLITNESSSYQWFVNGLKIEGATEMEFTPDSTGYYTVKISGENACQSKMSEPYYFDITDVANSSGQAYMLNIYPNPASDIINIEYSIYNPGYFTLEVFDMIGNKLAEFDNGVKVIGNQKLQIETNNYSSGLYYVILIADETSICRKFSVIR